MDGLALALALIVASAALPPPRWSFTSDAAESANASITRVSRRTHSVHARCIERSGTTHFSGRGRPARARCMDHGTEEGRERGGSASGGTLRWQTTAPSFPELDCPAPHPACRLRVEVCFRLPASYPTLPERERARVSTETNRIFPRAARAMVGKPPAQIVKSRVRGGLRNLAQPTRSLRSWPIVGLCRS